MKVLILGGDGYLGWPTALHLSALGHEVAVADNYLRRTLAREQDSEPLLRSPNLHERTAAWRLRSGQDIKVFIGDLADWSVMERVFKEFQPNSIVHYAEQPSAPYSMLDRPAATLTLVNNLTVTSNLVHAVNTFTPDAHIVKLGTMGEYGTPAIDIEEGWIDIDHKGRRDKFLFPRQAGSLYHTTKIMDTDLLWFYVRAWKIRVTDLMQGPVYGVFTDQTSLAIDLLPSFSYDELFGTVLNRFIVQAAVGYPLTVYGKGGQTRGYINLRDTMRCIQLALENPPGAGELRILNQFTETFSVNELAERVTRAGKQLSLDVQTKSISNPRIEKEEHYYNPVHSGLTALGLQPHLLSDEVLAELLEFALAHKAQIQTRTIFRGTKWN